MEYNIVVASDLEGLAIEVAGFIPQGWKLKGGIVEHMNGFAQQLVRHPGDIKRKKRNEVAKEASKQRRTRWIE